MKKISIKAFIICTILCAVTLLSCSEDAAITRNDIKVEKLTASPVAITMATGDVRAIKAEVIPLGANQMIYWKSANPEIAEVANGIIMGISPGITTISVNSVEDASKRAEVSVTVVAAAIPVGEISFGIPSPLTVYLDETVQLHPQILPENATIKDILWKNSNPQVATVSENGLITPLQRGTTTFSIYAASDVNKTATLNVTVTLRSISVESLSFTNAQVKMKPGETYTATVNILPTDASNKAVTWSSDNEAVATVANGVIKGIGIGNAVITVTSDENSDIKAELNVAVASDPDPFDVLVSAKGLWRFSDGSNIGKASIGKDLTPVVASGRITALDGGIVRVGMSSYFICEHGIPVSGSGYVSEYTMLYDFKIPSTSPWYVFYLAKPGENDEGEVYINGNRLGHSSYSSFTATSGVWYRLMVVYKGDGTIYLYIDGSYIHQYSAYGDATKSLAPVIRLLTDGWGGYDAEMDISTVAIWDHALTDAEIAALGVAE